MLVDTLLLRIELGVDEEIDFDGVLARAREGVLATLEHAELPLDRVVGRLLRTRGGTRGGVAVPNVMLNFAGFAEPQPRFRDLACELTASMPGSRFDLTIYAYPREGRLELEAAFRSELFEVETIVALLEQVAGVIERRSVARVGVEVGPTSSETGPSLALVPTISSWTCERVAVVSADASMSYAQLNDEARAIARELKAGQRVAIFATRSPATIVALLAVLTARASFVMLDAAHPSARLIEMIELTQPSAWLALDGDPPAEVVHVLREHARDTLPVESPTEAYVTFTSGTTGRPRGVIGTLEPLEHFFAWYRGALSIDTHDRFAWLSGIGHDPTLRDILGALCSGAEVHVPPRAPAQLGAELGRWLAQSEITVVHWTPSLARMLAATQREPLPALRRVCFGGDRLRGEDVRTWQRLAPNAELFNFYGTTETPQAIAMHRITEADAQRPLVPIGRGIEGVTLEVENAAIGEVGEIVVHTRHLARGYLGEPELTRARFGAGCYRTGDLGRRRHDGSVVCLGRIDDQIQIRGERVEIAEVEAVLSELAGARVAVSARETEDGERELVAWLAGSASVLVLREAAAARLPRALLPTRWATIDELPLTANAKLDRAALARLDVPSLASIQDQEAPATVLEQALAPIWAEILGRDRVGRHDDFFAIGGHSLLAVRLAVRIHEALGVELPIWVLFERPTLAGCAEAIERGRVAGLPELGVVEHGPLAPASFIQAHIWLLHQLEDGPQPSIMHSLRLREALDDVALAQALVELERRHEVLRTTFVLIDERLCVRVGSARASVLERGAPSAAVRFDLERGPVWRAHLWLSEDGEQRLSIELHHICAEAGSMRILVRDLLELYQAAREDRAPVLPKLECRYVDVAVWQRELSESAASLQALARWRERLQGVEPLELPRVPNKQNTGARGGWLELEIERELVHHIDQLATRESTTPFVVILCALTAVLARWCGSADVTIGAPVGMRPHPATRELVGPFLDLVALRLDASGDPTLHELLVRARARVREAFADSLVPFERILQALYDSPRERTLDRAPVFQVLLNMVDVGETERLWAKLGAERVIEHEVVPRHELAVYAIRRPNSMSLAVLYDASRFDAEQGHALLEHLRASLLTSIERPQSRLSELPLRRPDSDRPTASVPARNDLPYARFVAIARTHPHAIAIDMRTHTLSYADLHAHVETVATHLRGATRVGLLVREDEHMAAGMLAALALGITYVPLDPRLPPARLRELIADAEPDALACTASLASLALTLAEGRPVSTLDAPYEHASLSPTASPDAIAYLLYTSGSTGRPKAVMQSQANLLHHALTYAERLALAPGDRVSLVATHAFDAAVMDIYGALLSGATLCPIDLHGDALLDLDTELRERAITIFHATPTVVRHLLATRTTQARLDRVRAVVLGGEEAHATDAIAIANAFRRDVQLINGLGPTECTLALQEFVDPPSPPGSLAVGTPVPGVSVSLETPLGDQPVLYGIGEIVLESPHVALGYWHRPRATERAFSQRNGQRRYHTGDLGRWLPGGRIGFVGRRGGFIKLHGHRIEPGEIEARLRAQPSVREAAVILRDSELLGFFTARAQTPSEQELLRALAAELPSWMLPARLIHLDAMPRTPTGKLDRRALAQLSVPPIIEEKSPPRPTTTSEAEILAIWTHILTRPPARLDLDWFTCGGDSLGAARLVRALDRRLGLALSLAEMFEGCTIEHLARRLDGHDGLAREYVSRVRQLADAPGDPWICVLPPGSKPELLAPLASRLGRSLWTIEPPSFGEHDPLPSIDMIIDAITRALARAELCTRSGSQRGWVLAGISNGGLLACELLATLPATSRPRALVLFDSPTPELLATRPWSARSEATLRAGFAEAHPRVREHDPSIDEADLAAMFNRYCKHGERVWQVLHRLDLRARIEAEAILIEARNGHARLGDRWRMLAPNLRTHAVAAGHLDMFAEQHVDALVEVLLGSVG